MPQDEGRFLAGSDGALSPPPVQVVTFERWLIMHWRVNVEPQALASVAHRRNEDVDCSPNAEVRPPDFQNPEPALVCIGTIPTRHPEILARRTGL
jgi:hypothetical protein